MTHARGLFRRYNRRFYANNLVRGRSSAQRIAEIVWDLYAPKSVLDVGCGAGMWLEVFRDLGTTSILGLDGAWVDREMLTIPQKNFMAVDLEEGFAVEDQYDLAICLEVAEHLTEQGAKKTIAALARTAPAILFSAAIPYQGGVHHKTERWPSWWLREFSNHGLEPFDVIRPVVWNDESVLWWYTQNTLLYVQRDHFLAERCRALASQKAQIIIDMVHPRLYEGKATLEFFGARELLVRTSKQLIRKLWGLSQGRASRE